MTTLLDGRVLVSGGNAVNASTSELFDPATNSFVATGPMRYLQRYLHRASLLPSGRVMVTGGYINYDGTIYRGAAAEFFNPASLRWNTGPALPNLYPIGHEQISLPSGLVLVIGGSGGDLLSHCFTLMLLCRNCFRWARRRDCAEAGGRRRGSDC